MLSFTIDLVANEPSKLQTDQQETQLKKKLFTGAHESGGEKGDCSFGKVQQIKVTIC